MSRRTNLFGRLLRGALFVRRGRIALAVLAIAIGTSVAAALLLVTHDVGAKVSRELRAYGPNLMVMPRGDFVDAARGLPTLGREERAWLVAERARGALATFATLRYGVARRADRSYVLAATDLPDLAAVYPAWKVHGGGHVDAYVGQTAARELGVVAGDSLTLTVAQGADARPLTLGRIAILDAGGGEDRVVFVDRALAAVALGGDPEAFHLALARADGPGAAVLAYAARPQPLAGLRPTTVVRPIRRLSAADGDVLNRLRALLGTVTAVALLAALICAMSTLADLVLERTKEIALLRALGAGRRDVLALFGAEALVMGLAGGALGLALGIVAAQAIGKGVFGTAIAIAPMVIPQTLALGVITAGIASFLPVRHALTIEPAPVLRGE